MICQYGCGNNAKFQLKNKKWCCESYFTKCPNYRTKISNIILLKHKSGNYKNAKYVAWNKGLTNKTDIRVKNNSIARGNSLRGKPGHFQTDETKQKIKKFAKLHKYGGYKKGSGRGKHGWYKDFWCDSSWELAYVIYCLEHNIKIERNTKKFAYIIDGKTKNYIPDFKENNSWVEIKGYMGKEAIAKLSQFPEDIKILDFKTIQPYLIYVKQKYGKDFIRFYEKLVD